jgi:hypothetical protein
LCEVAGRAQPWTLCCEGYSNVRSYQDEERTCSVSFSFISWLRRGSGTLSNSYGQCLQPLPQQYPFSR